MASLGFRVWRLYCITSCGYKLHTLLQILWQIISRGCGLISYSCKGNSGKSWGEGFPGHEPYTGSGLPRIAPFQPLPPTLYATDNSLCTPTSLPTVTALPPLTHQASENSLSSAENWSVLGNLGGGPFTTAFSCSNIVVQRP